ncbi:MAG: alpha/beta hydrolase [Pseudomonadota bacterium]
MTWTTQPRSDLHGLAAIVAGAGPQVLLFHGVGLRAEAWGAQIDALSPVARVVAVDMPGHGHSPLRADLQMLADYTDAIAALLNQPTVVVGHSMGAMIALDLAARHPQHVIAVAALNGIYQRSPSASAAVQARAQALDGVTVQDPEPTLTRWFGSDAAPARTACATWLRAVDPAGYRAAYTVFAHTDGPSPTALENLHCPALFMTGAEEPNSTPAMSRAMAHRAPQGRAEVVAGAAHMMPMTHPGAVNAALSTLLHDTCPAERT